MILETRRRPGGELPPEAVLTVSYDGNSTVGGTLPAEDGKSPRRRRADSNPHADSGRPPQGGSAAAQYRP